MVVEVAEVVIININKCFLVMWMLLTLPVPLTLMNAILGPAERNSTRDGPSVNR